MYNRTQVNFFHIVALACRSRSIHLYASYHHSLTRIIFVKNSFRKHVLDKKLNNFDKDLRTQNVKQENMNKNIGIITVVGKMRPRDKQLRNFTR